MPDWLIYVLAVPLSAAVVIGCIVALVFLFGVIANLFSRKLDHPRLGPLRRAPGDHWRGRMPCRSGLAPRDGRVAIVLPGAARGPDPEAETALLALDAQWPALDAALREHLGAEAEAMAENLSDAERAASPTLEEIAVGRHEETGALTIELHALQPWDPEHVRTLALDASLRPRAFGPSFADLQPLAG